MTDSVGTDGALLATSGLDSGSDTICNLPAEICPDVIVTSAGLECGVPGVTCSFQVGAPQCDWRCTCGVDGVWGGCDACCGGPIP
jgi:hypothetical protein